MACAIKTTGLVESGDLGTRLVEPDGRTLNLVLVEESQRPLSFMEGHLVWVEGRRVFKNVQVSDWGVDQGLHGLPTWVGVLEQKGMQLGLQDRNSGAFYFLDEEASSVLGEFVGKPILVEGYVDGAHRVRVSFFRVLAPEG